MAKTLQDYVITDQVIEDSGEPIALSIQRGAVGQGLKRRKEEEERARQEAEQEAARLKAEEDNKLINRVGRVVQDGISSFADSPISDTAVNVAGLLPGGRAVAEGLQAFQQREQQQADINFANYQAAKERQATLEGASPEVQGAPVRQDYINKQAENLSPLPEDLQQQAAQTPGVRGRAAQAALDGTADPLAPAIRQDLDRTTAGQSDAIRRTAYGAASGPVDDENGIGAILSEQRTIDRVADADHANAWADGMQVALAQFNKGAATLMATPLGMATRESGPIAEALNEYADKQDKIVQGYTKRNEYYANLGAGDLDTAEKVMDAAAWNLATNIGNLAGFAGGPARAAYMTTVGMQTYGNAIDEGNQLGLAPALNHARAVGQTIGEIGSEYMPFGVADKLAKMGNAIPTSAKAAFLKRMAILSGMPAAVVGAEGAEEVVNSVWGAMVDNLVAKAPGVTDQQRAALEKPLFDAEREADAFVKGAMGAGPGGLVAAIPAINTIRQTDAAERNINTLLDKLSQRGDPSVAALLQSPPVITQLSDQQLSVLERTASEINTARPGAVSLTAIDNERVRRQVAAATNTATAPVQNPGASTAAEQAAAPTETGAPSVPSATNEQAATTQLDPLDDIILQEGGQNGRQVQGQTPTQEVTGVDSQNENASLLSTNDQQATDTRAFVDEVRAELSQLEVLSQQAREFNATLRPGETAQDDPLGGERAPQLNDISNEQVRSQFNELASAVDNIFGGRTIGYEDAEPGAQDGFAYKGAAFVNVAGMKTPAAWVLFHEHFHGMEQLAKAGDVVAQRIVNTLRDGVYNLISEDGKRAYAEKYLFKKRGEAGANLTLEQVQADPAMAEELKSEMVADFMGKRGTDRKFMRQLARRNPKGFGEFVTGWLKSLGALISELKGRKSQGVANVDQYIKELETAKKIAEDSLVEWQQLYGKQAERELQSEPMGGVQFARKKPSTARKTKIGPFDTATDKAGNLVVYGDPQAIRALLPDDIKGRGSKEGVTFTLTAAPRVKAALQGRNIAYGRGGEVQAKKPMKDGKYAGAPEKFNTPGKVVKLREWLRQLTREGEAGRFWYENSSKEVLRMVGGDVAEARKFVALLSVYSPQAKVDTNSTFALRAWAQYKAGKPINVKSAVQDAKAQAALDNVDEYWSGEKTGNFVTNLLRMIDPDRPQGATIDMWMMRAAYYTNDVPTATQYAFMEDETNRIAREFGWEPQQVQAAIWVAMKARMENKGVKQRTEASSKAKGWISFKEGKHGKGKVRVIHNAQAHRDNWLKHAFEHHPTKTDTQTAKFDFQDGLLRHIGQISFEARPGRSTGVLPGIHAAPYDQQVEYQQEFQKALYDEQGRDLLAMKLGLLVDNDLLAPGVWQSDVSPSLQKTVAMAPGKGTDGGGTSVDPAQAEALNVYTAVLGLVGKQEGVGWHRPFYKGKVSEENGVELRAGRPFTPDEAKAVESAVRDWMMANGKSNWEDRFAFISSPQGLRMVNFGVVSNKELQSAILKVVEPVAPDYHPVGFSSDGNMPTNDWKKNPDGTAFTTAIRNAGRSDLLGWARDFLAPRVQRVNEDFSKRYGWGNPGQIQFRRSQRDGDQGLGSGRAQDRQVQAPERAAPQEAVGANEPLPGAPRIEGFTGPDPRLVAVAEQYARDNNIPLRRQAEYVQVDPERAARIAQAYEAMPHAPDDPLVKAAYKELIRQTVAQYRALEKAGYKFWFIDLNEDSNQEYVASPWNAMRDIRANQTLGVFPTDDGFGSSDFDPATNPLLESTNLKWPSGSLTGPLKPVLANDLFRAVHDAFGHGLEGAGFRAQGEENAWQAHVRLFTGSAVGALTSETRGQNSWLNYGPYGEQNRAAKVEDTVFADQKAGLLPEWAWTEGRAGDMEKRAVAGKIQFKRAQRDMLDEFVGATNENPLDDRERITKAWDAGIEVRPEGDAVHISSIRSFEQGKGAGSRALELLTTLADKHRVQLTLIPEAFGSKALRNNQLRAWYARHGFVDDPSSDVMVREPKLPDGPVVIKLGGKMREIQFKRSVSQLVMINEVAKNKKSWGRHLEKKHIAKIEGETSKMGLELNAAYLEAAQQKDAFDELITALAEATGVEALTASLKGRDSAVEKIVGDYNGDATKIKDLLRGTISTQSLAQARQIYGILAQKAKLADVAGNDKSDLDPSKPSKNAAGYRDAKLILDINGVPAELIIAPEAMLQAKEIGHPLYEDERKLESKIQEALARNDLATARKIEARRAELQKKMAEIYAPAYERSQSSRASLREMGLPLSRTVENLIGRLSGSNAQQRPGSNSTTGMSSKSQKTADTGNSASGLTMSGSLSRVSSIPQGRGPQFKRRFEPQQHEGYARALNKAADYATGRNTVALANPIPVMATPGALQTVKALKRGSHIIGTGSTIYLKGTNKHDNSAHNAAIPVDVLHQLPQLLADPLAIYDKAAFDKANPKANKTVNEALFLVVLPVKVEGEYVTVAITPDSKFGTATVNFIKSVHTRAAKTLNYYKKHMVYDGVTGRNEEAPQASPVTMSGGRGAVESQEQSARHNARGLGTDITIREGKGVDKPKTRADVPQFKRRAVTETAEFKRWFGDSKVVDEGGKPLVVYHGTPYDFSWFDPETSVEGGFFFSVSPEHASKFASKWGDEEESPNVKPVYLSLQDPLVVDGKTLPRDHSMADIERLFKRAVKGGHDGIIIRRFKDAGAGTADTYIAFRPEQIKSAVGNNGQFDPANPDIRFKRRAVTETAEFKRWFGDSKVVDENGQPLVVYHGSDAEFNIFDTAKAKDGAHWFVADESHAASFGNPRDFYVSIQNPMRISQDDLDAAWDEEHPDGEQDDRSLLPRDFVDQFVAKAKKEGHDGLIIEDMGDRDITATMYLPFRPEQIKSAIGNNGQFDPANPDIRFKRRAVTETAEFKRWFGDSKVVDENGQPLVVYHGTPYDFSWFDTDKGDANRSGAFFSADPDVGMFADREGGRVIPAYLSLTNPLVVPWGSSKAREYSKGALIAEGYDGIIYEKRLGGINMAVAFNPTQIKSAVGNNGQFDPANPDIRFKRRAVTETAEFKRWFGDSKVVDENGQPLVVYHGTAEDFSVFTDENAPYRGGILAFFTTATGFANDYAGDYEGSKVLPVYLRIEKPFDFRTDGEQVAIDFLAATGGLTDRYEINRIKMGLGEDVEINDNTGPLPDEDFIKAVTEGNWDALEAPEFVEWLRGQGYDGIITKENGAINYAVFDPTQIKSAIGNNGQFDPANPDIRFKRRQPGTGSQFALPEETDGRAITRLFQNDQVRWYDQLNLIRERGGVVNDQNDVYQAMERMVARAMYRTEDFFNKRVTPVLKEMRDANVTLDELGEYLYALHAKERNAEVKKNNPRFANAGYDDVGGSGMSDREADEIIARVKASPKAADLNRFAKAFRSWSEDNLANLVQGGLLTQQQADDMRKKYPNYVPLRGYADGSEADGFMGGGSGFSNAKRLFNKALGRSSRAYNPAVYILHSVAEGMVAKEKANVGNYLERLIQDNPDDKLWTIGKPEKEQVSGPKGTVIERDMGFDPAKEVRFIRNGKEVRIQIKDPLLLRAYNNQGTEAMHSLLKASGAINAFLRQMWTQKNPVFPLVNVLRDIPSSVLYATGEHGFTFAMSMARYYPQAFKAAWQLAGEKPVTGAFGNTVREYRAAGGGIGFRMVSDIENTMNRVQNLQKKLGQQTIMQALRDGEIKQAGKRLLWRTYNNALIDLIERINATFENMSRIAIFAAARERGMPPAEAARMSKNVTVNFNRRGEQGPNANALFLFMNAAVQGLAKDKRSIMDAPNKNQARAVLAAYALLGVAVAALSGDDDEEELIAENANVTSIKFRLGDKTVTIPLAYASLGFSYYLGRSLYKMMSGDASVGEQSLRLASALLTHLSPVNPIPNADDPQLADVAVAATPTAAKLPMMVVLNRNGFGSAMRPDYNNDPDAYKAFRGTRGSVYAELSAWMNESTGGTTRESGLVDVSPETIKGIVSYALGGTGRFVGDAASTGADLLSGDPDINSMPVVNRFVKEEDVTMYRSRFYRQASEAKKKLELFNKYSKDKNREKMKEFAPWQQLGRKGNRMWDRMNGLRDEELKVSRNETLTDSVRRQKLEELAQKQIDLANEYHELFKEKAPD